MAASFMSILSSDAILLDVDLGKSKEDVIRELAKRVEYIGRSGDAFQLAEDMLKRENQSSTGIPGGIAIPHCRTSAVAFPTIVFARLATPIDFDAPDKEKADLIFGLMTPSDGLISHTKLLSRLARALVHEETFQKLRSAQDADTVLKLLSGPLGNSGPLLPPPPARSQKQHILAVTACPTGIAHTYMSAEALEHAVHTNFPDVELHVETQGAGENQVLTDKDIENADAIIFASDIAITDRDRFASIPSISVGVKQALNSPNTVIQQAVELAKLSASKSPLNEEASHRNRPHRSRNTFLVSVPETLNGKISAVGQAIMTGVSYMIPFVAAGGLLIAIGFLVGGFEVGNVASQVLSNYSLDNLPPNLHYLVAENPATDFVTSRSGLALFIGALLYSLGQVAMGFIIPVLSGYIAYGLGGRAAIAPGFIGGAVSLMLGAGFIGGLVTGVLTGLIVFLLRLIPVPSWLETLMPVVVIPLVASFIIGMLMLLLIGEPLADGMHALQNWLTSMSNVSAVLLGILLGVMMCSDLGGPINKSAYLFATAGLATQTTASFQIMAAVMAAGMVPPLGLALATLLRKQLFRPNERQNGKAAWLLGLSFVTEGAVPFAATDPLRVLPATTIGGAVTGGLSMALHVGSRAPHGGIFVIFAIDNPLGFLASIAAGTIVTALFVIFAKGVIRRKKSREKPKVR